MDMNVKIAARFEAVIDIVNGISSILKGMGVLCRYTKSFEDLNDLSDYFFLTPRMLPKIIKKFEELRDFKEKPHVK